MLRFPEPPQDPNRGADLDPVAVAVPARDWADVPPHRRLGIVWHLTGPMRAEQGDNPCPVGLYANRFPRDAVAALGSDRRFHVVADGSDTPCQGEVHRQWTLWATDGSRYRVQEWGEAGWRACTDQYVEWTVRLGGERRAPMDVPTGQRCPILAPCWPRYADGSRLGDIRRCLTEEFGSNCVLCGLTSACFVDHDPSSGLVRGYLCVDCNSRVDQCLHASGCAFADYLNDPPAFRLRLVYPKSPTKRQRERLAQVRELIADTPELEDVLPSSAAETVPEA